MILIARGGRGLLKKLQNKLLGCGLLEGSVPRLPLCSLQESLMRIFKVMIKFICFLCTLIFQLHINAHLI